ncbi:MAG: flagellar motor switch protein FliG [Kiritimatiellae bacterium]|nr:flagellar motor switch protein FliG [Kiritimatiellia bacterium]
MANAHELKNLSKLQKVAIFLASLDEQMAASILQQMPTELMAQLSSAIGNLGAVSGRVREQVVNECLREIAEFGTGVFGDANLATNLLTQAVGEKRASALLADQFERKDSAFQQLRDVEGDQLASILAHEQPGIIALVLRFVSPRMAADVLGALPKDVRTGVVVRMATADMPPTEDVISGIEQFLESKLVRSKSRKSVATEDKVGVLANILQHSDNALEDELMTAIEDSSPVFASELRDRLFTFEDVVKLSDVAVRRILQEIDTSVLAIALRNSSVALKEKFFSNMSKRASEGLKEDMEYSPKMRLSEVENKQREIVNIIRALETSGQITVSRSEEDKDVFI